MDVRQLSIFDNIPLEEGYEFLANLQLPEALEKFGEARDYDMQPNETAEIIEICKYWHAQLILLNDPKLTLSEFNEIIENYSSYVFPKTIQRFKIGLLKVIIEKEKGFDFKQWLTMFDLLLKNGEFHLAEQYITSDVEVVQNNKSFLYLIAQAQWLDGNKSQALINYAKALLNCPDQYFNGRIESKELKELAKKHDPSLAVGYAWVDGLIPYIPIKDSIKIQNNEHQRAIHVCNLLVKADEAAKKADLSQSVRFRKELKQSAPALYEEYFKLLKRRRR